MKIAGTVILYNPDVSVLNNLHSYYLMVGHLFIYDNSPNKSTEIEGWAANSENIAYTSSGNNEGIAKRLNQAVEAAKEAGYDWLLTMDQDSFFEEREIANYWEALEGASEKEKTAMFGVGFDQRKVGEGRSTSEEIDFLITSGSVVNLSLVDMIGGFDEALFIDEVDWEYCFRAKSKGYRIVKFPNILLRHDLGEVKQFVSLKSFKTTPRTLHSPLRIYYMVRNYLYVAKSYHNLFPKSAEYRRRSLLTRLKNNLLYGSKRLQLIGSILQGYKDFINNKMGKKT